MLLLLQSTYILAVKKAGYLKIKTKTAIKYKFTS